MPAVRTGNKLRLFLILVLAALLGTGTLAAHPANGTPAPPLAALTLLQAPTGAKASWASLKGKVVVLEFWATWCSPCVASLPHLNQLVATLDPARFQFLSIDDEDEKTVRNFLTRKKTSGWVSIDASGSVFAAYGITSRPTTVIIDASGKVAAVTEIDSVTAGDLEAIAQRKPVALKPAMQIVKASAPSNPDQAKALFVVTVSKSSPTQKDTTVEHPPTGTDFLGNGADGLITNVFDVFSGRYALKGTLPEDHYDLQVNLGNVPEAQARPIVQQAVLAALHLQIEPKTITRRAYILRATDASHSLLSQSASTHAAKRGSWHGRYVLMNGTMDDLAYILATGLETPILNETGIQGNYDARFQAAAGGSDGDVDSINTVLRSTLGLELVPGDQDASITVLEVSQRHEGEPSASGKTQGSTH